MKHLDTKTLNFLIYCCMFWKTICPFLGFAYIVGWLTLIFEDPIHLIINDVIGWLPALIDGLFLHQTSISGDEYRMGYVYSAALIILSMYFAFKLQVHLNDCKMTKENEVKIVEVKKIKRNNDVKKKPVDDTHRYTHFFGLLELNLEYLIEDGKTSDQLIKLKNEYLKMLVNQLGKKYTNVKFKSTDKVFFISDEFLIFEPFLSDVSKLYKIFVDLDNQKSIKTELFLSFSCGNENNNVEYVEKVLQKVNELKYTNKVIAINDLYKKYKAMKAKQFEFHSLGVSRIELDAQKEIDVDLYYLKKNLL